MLSVQLSEKIASKLYSQIPEFERYIKEIIDDEFQSNTYLIMGPFGNLLNSWIISDAYNQLIDKSYDFINQLCSENDRDVEQMLKVTFFEHLIDYKQSIELSKMKLKGQALKLFSEVLNSSFFEVANMLNRVVYPCCREFVNTCCRKFSNS